MDVQEHFYDDDPRHGPADARTTLTETDYFFLGNGRIQAAVQVCRSGAATPLGLLIMDPERFGPKRAALTFDPDTGLRGTVVGIEVEGGIHEPQADDLRSEWIDPDRIPVVKVGWTDRGVEVEERFCCPSGVDPIVSREIRIRRLPAAASEASLVTGDGHRWPLPTAEAWLTYRLTEGRVEISQDQDRWPIVSGSRPGLARCATGTAWDRLFDAARRQLPAVISSSGAMDGSIWQYNREWVRDQAMVVIALAQMGAHELARTMLVRLLREFVTRDGDTIDSSEQRPNSEVELDQNGELLLALKAYVDWTGDLAVARDHWPIVRALAEFPLRAVFRHAESGLLHNRREYWERHHAHGIRDGMELTYQLFVSIGLESAAELAGRLGHSSEGQRWAQAAGDLRRAMLENERFGLVHEGCLIKRRGVDGKVQAAIETTPEAGLPDGVPLAEPAVHRLNPDTSAILPIAFEFIDPQGDLAGRTLEENEQLWNLRWEGGGYSRYHVSSEPDSPGPWAFPSVFVARALLEAEQDERLGRVLDWLLEIGGAPGTWFEFYGPRPVPPYPQVGIPPWTWAEIGILFLHHLAGVRPHPGGVTIRPRLPSRVPSLAADVRIGAHRLHLRVRRKGIGEATPIELPPLDGDTEVEAVVP